MSLGRSLSLSFVSALFACSGAPDQGASPDKCIKASDCDIGLACDKGRCVAVLSPQSTSIPAPVGLPKVKVKGVAPFDLQTNDQNSGSAPTKIPVDNQVVSVPITELGIGGARLGMSRSEWFTVPNGEFVPAEPGDPKGVDARGLAEMDGVHVIALFKDNILCQMSTKSDHAATMLGIRPGDPAYQLTEKYGSLSMVDPRYAEKLKGITFRFRMGQTPLTTEGEVPSTAVVDEIIVGACNAP